MFPEIWSTFLSMFPQRTYEAILCSPLEQRLLIVLLAMLLPKFGEAGAQKRICGRTIISPRIYANKRGTVVYGLNENFRKSLGVDCQYVLFLLSKARELRCIWKSRNSKLPVFCRYPRNVRTQIRTVGVLSSQKNSTPLVLASRHVCERPHVVVFRSHLNCSAHDNCRIRNIMCSIENLKNCSVLVTFWNFGMRFSISITSQHENPVPTHSFLSLRLNHEPNKRHKTCRSRA